ncbi:hypothetical protein Clacol_000289 [Clathrus columnatus]|uniref:Uncharacterized protein n=1 Tax=Clathrus columnatus TaxID=1419009 RepID=A0AAV5A2I4_9AGAM|nr:hypothetical protein Clacol_000289 [Clathrus columnatus]
MAGATIISVSLTVIHQYWDFGDARYLYVLWGLWWLDSILSFICAFGLVYIMSAYHSVPISSLTPRWLLPVMTLIVASTTGQQLANALIPISTRNSFITISVSLLMLSVGLILVFMILTLWIRRLLFDGGLPDAMAVPSAFLPLGPCGQSGFSLLLAGLNFNAILPTGSGAVFGDPLMGRILNGICFSFAFTFWSLELWWLLSAIVTLLHFKIRKIQIPFNLSTWSLVFPNVRKTRFSLYLSDSIDTIVLKILGAIQIIIVIIIWVALAIQTLVHIIDGSIFQPADGPLPTHKELIKTSSIEQCETEGSLTRV